MGPNITLTAFDGLIILGPFFAMVAAFIIGNYIVERQK